MHIELVSLIVGDEYAKVVELGTSSKRKYCLRHGYHFHCCREHLVPDRPVPWSKIPLLESRLEQGKTIVCLDADTLIMNADVNLTSLLSDCFPADKSLLLARDCCDNLNTGVFAMRGDDRSRRLLKTMFGLVEFTHHPWWENKALIHLYETQEWVREAIAIVPDYRLLHSYPPELWGQRGFRLGDFILHFAGVHVPLELQGAMKHYDDLAGADRFEVK